MDKSVITYGSHYPAVNKKCRIKMDKESSERRKRLRQ